jgi:hypothetical protein
MQYGSISKRVCYVCCAFLIAGVTGTAAAQNPQKILAPSTGAYVGAAVNPGGYSPANDTNFETDLENETETFEATLPGNLQIHTRYFGWTHATVTGGSTTYAATFPDQGMSDDVTHGRVTLVSWTCGSDASFNQEVSSGAQDAAIDTEAAAISAFGSPIFIRFEWEINESQNSCNGSAADFKAAWQHLVTRFKTDGVTNVTWVWNPGGNITSSNYYPGDAYVDWVADDTYGDNAATFLYQFFNTFYDYWSKKEPAKSGVLGTNGTKPIMLGEFGACPVQQQGFFNGLINTHATSFPQVKAYVYWNSYGSSYRGCAAAPSPQPWVLEGDGATAFSSFYSTVTTPVVYSY